MADTLRLEIVTPEAIVFSEDVDMVTLPGVEGQMGVYPQHVPLITQIVPGRDHREPQRRPRPSWPSAKGSSRSTANKSPS